MSLSQVVEIDLKIRSLTSLKSVLNLYIFDVQEALSTIKQNGDQNKHKIEKNSPVLGTLHTVGSLR